MKKFDIYNKNIYIGWSNLRKKDASTGVVYGQFCPVDSYKDIQSLIQRRIEIDKLDKKEAVILEQALKQVELKVKPENGEFFEAPVEVQINDFSRELAPNDIEVLVLGLDYLAYKEWFDDEEQEIFS
ncbi:hypothetical protein QUF63_01645 [Anaerolineales bacterium HSG25]|nr:hypothetical protein [Anaerolineales bacterium HSG25]